jgi:hypothetical protein
MRLPMATQSNALIFGSLLFLMLVAIFLGIRLRILSPSSAAIVMFLFPLIYKVIVGFLQNEEPLQIVCDGFLLSIIFGPATYVFGIAVEKWRSQNNN